MKSSEHRHAAGDSRMVPDQVKDLPRSLDVLIVIVNYKTAGLTIDCLRSLEPEVASFRGGQVRVVVTDNASPDDSVDQLKAAVDGHGWASWAEIRPLDRNGGFAYGNNAAIRPALESESPPDYVWLLNPDTVVRPGALGALIEFMQENPEVGIAGSRLEWPDGIPQGSMFRFPSILGELEGGMRLGLASRLLSRWIVPLPVVEKPSRCDWIAGASMIVRRTVFESIGLMDEGFFMYFEEVDFCKRAREAGHACWYEPGSRVVHLVGQSSGVTDIRHAQKRRPGYWFAARRRYFRSHLGRVRTVLADLAWSLGFASYRIRQWVQRKPDSNPQNLLRDFIHHNFLRPNGS